MCTIVGVSYSKKILTTFKKPGWTISFALGMARIMFTWLKCLMTVGQVSIVVHQSSEPMPGWGRSLLAEIERVSHEFILARLSEPCNKHAYKFQYYFIPLFVYFRIAGLVFKIGKLNTKTTLIRQFNPIID
jgi:hypothetical protein